MLRESSPEHIHQSDLALTPRWILLLAGLLLLLSGCATYKPAPLDDAFLEQSLSPPDSETVWLAASNLSHPYLHPISLDFSDGLSSEEAAVVSVVTNPQLRAARARKGVAQAQLIAAGVLPNPELSGSMEVPFDDTTGAITGLSLGLSFDLMDLLTRPSERAAAKASLKQVSLDLAWQEWQVAQAARQQVFDAAFLEQQSALAKEQEEALKNEARVLTDAGKRRLVTETERAAAESAYLQARAERLDIGSQLDTTRLGLLRMLGFPPEAELHLDPSDIPYGVIRNGTDAGDDTTIVATAFDTTGSQFACMPTADSLLDKLERSRIDLIALRYGYESQDAALRAAILRQFPSITIGLTGGQATDRVKTIGPTLAIRLPFLDRNQGEIAVARATREQLRQEYAARVFETRSLVSILFSRLTSLQKQLLSAEVSARTERNLVAAYGVAFRMGNADVLTYYDARKDLIDAEIAVVRFRQALASVTLAIETATGDSQHIITCVL